MKVLFCTRGDVHARPAGDTVQIVHTAAYLEEHGVQVDFGDAARDPHAYDVVHLFGMTPIAHALQCFRRASACGIPVVITPIYWDLRNYYRLTRSAGRLLLWENSRALRREILTGCACVYPSGQGERMLLEREAGGALPYVIVRGGIDAARFATPSTAPLSLDVLCAARVCPRKNQLALARACAHCGCALTLVGPVTNASYLDACLGYPNVRYAGCLQEDALRGLYGQARVHALPSFAETPGLASMEAAAAGCNVLSTSAGDAEEYFAHEATYCDPYTPGDVSRALALALSYNAQPALGARIRAEYDWAACLAPLWDSYCALIGQTVTRA